ncbi:MAG TPA: alpha/beta hydrolase [Frankiaceae bacterium]|nr:alpha/beta hydrolase [Frankiaceae bacterium]
MEQKERYVDVRDTRLFVVERGTGFPLVVLHGGPGLDHHEFADYLDPLTDHYRLVLVDQRAQGRSDEAPPETWTIKQMAADVNALGDALGYGPYAVLGHSYGGFVALQHAVDFTGEPAGTIVSCGLPSARFLDGVTDALAAFEPVELRQQVAASWEAEEGVETPEDVKKLLDDQMPFHFADPRDPRISDYAARTSQMEPAPDVLRHFATRAYGGIEVEAALPTVAHPVLVLAGRHDRAIPVEGAHAIADGIPGSELMIFEHSAHVPFAEEQDRYLEVVRDFLDRVRR